MGTTIHPDAERLHAYDAQVRRMVADSDMRGPVLAVGLALAWLIREQGPGEKIGSRRIAETAKLDHFEVRRVLADDAPVYRIEAYYRSHLEARCEAPMIRREGLCGNVSASYRVRELNWDDGTISIHWFCTRHKLVGEETERALKERDSRLRAERGDPPKPAANHGGLLQRHFPGVNWERIYTWARPGWEPPERVPESYTAPPFELQLIDGGAEEPEQVAGEPGGPPALTVVHGMPDRLAGRRPRPPRGPKPA